MLKPWTLQQIEEVLRALCAQRDRDPDPDAALLGEIRELEEAAAVLALGEDKTVEIEQSRPGGRLRPFAISASVCPKWPSSSPQEPHSRNSSTSAVPKRCPIWTDLAPNMRSPREALGSERRALSAVECFSSALRSARPESGNRRSIQLSYPSGSEGDYSIAQKTRPENSSLTGFTDDRVSPK